ncbi:DNA-dependent ATPase RAD54 SCDLUD_000839 [Saccharomycodes ludwigii]|uniref:DNA-dependent ATPase RAD54 n=1 Tax=Saccharomycodes ludwigii TaxID=36035 RepID=UPI001E83DD28|nr:hypothetical protein SCDLUD_000839 [Saccharomycodes ludwigii]KAH3903220.1 hypothetical protein SCDLUD_000839 [Saccharomycodes ludwigii]
MAKSRFPDRPPNGTGFGITPKKQPNPFNITQSYEKLTRPFKIPLNHGTRNRVNKAGTISTVTRSTRKAALVAQDRVSKALDLNHVLQENEEKEEEYTSTTVIKQRYDALSSTRYLEDSKNIEIKLHSKFNVPIKNYVRSHNLNLRLGMKPKLIDLPPRPLHDPYDDLAIVLYDPTTDGDMPDEGDDIQEEPSCSTTTTEEQTNKGATPSTTTDKKLVNIHPPKMNNGVKNKSLKELLGSDTNDEGKQKEKKKYGNVAVVIDPKLGKILRPHQIEGVRFLYRCVTGLVMKDFIKEKSNLLLLPSTPSTPLPSPDEYGIEGEEAEKESQHIKKKKKKKTKKEIEEEELNIKFKNQSSHAKNAYGCIMADGMGLGKTLQCLALLWTLLRQGPNGKPTINKAIIVCPSSLVGNWANEIVKWLGANVLTPLAIDGKKHSTNGLSVSDAIRQWANACGRQIVKPVLIISYETLRRNVDSLSNCLVGLMLADEGHRLKNEDSLTFTALNSINCNRRVILSGTPIQNDLSEYFALLNFSNPGLLGTRNQFRRNFEIPIIRGRDADADKEECLLGQKKLQDLSDIVSKFIIRRTNDILAKYLPCKYEHVVFCKLSPFQEKLYKYYIKSRDLLKFSGDLDNLEETTSTNNKADTPLKCIGVLKKLCNHPDLIDFEKDMPEIDLNDNLLIPEEYDPSYLHSVGTGRRGGGSGGNRGIQTLGISSKFSILERFLFKIRTESNDKIVIISNYTQTLDLIDKMCRSNSYGSLRLDGTMSVNKRQKLVDKFNDPSSNEFIFLLSSKAGGCGINLIGANRLILMDPDWNPAADQQALARVWRDGQKKDCFIYRFICTGTIEEKIYQRQSMKMNLSSCVVDEKEDVERLFSSDNLRKLFIYDGNCDCDTHNTFNCKRCKNGKQIIRSSAMLYGDATTWNHLNHVGLQKTNDHLLKNEFQFKDISYVFQYISHT